MYRQLLNRHSSMRRWTTVGAPSGPAFSMPAVVAWRLLMLAVLCLFTAGRGQATGIGDNYRKFLDLLGQSARDDSWLRTQRVAEVYPAWFPELSDARMDQLDLAEVEDLFNAAKLYEFYTKDSAGLDRMRAIYAVLARKGRAGPDEQADLYGGLVDQRRFREASDFAHEHRLRLDEALPSLPKPVPSETSHGYLRVNKDALAFQRAPMTGPEVIVVASPLCPYTRRAAAAIEHDPGLGRAFRRWAIWLVPEERALHMPAVRAWNAGHPGMPMNLVYHRKDWPLVRWWETPVFYFVLNGQLVRTVVGWPQAGQLQQLRQGLAQLHRPAQGRRPGGWQAVDAGGESVWRAHAGSDPGRSR